MSATKIMDVTLIRLSGCKFGEVAQSIWEGLTLPTLHETKVVKRSEIIYPSEGLGIIQMFGVDVYQSPSLVKSLRTGEKKIYPMPLVTADWKISQEALNWLAEPW